MPSTTPNPSRPAQAGKARRYRTVFVDWSKLGPTLCDQAARETPAPPPRPVVTTVDDQLDPVRKNVKDAAKAVLAWLSQAVSHGEDSNLDAVLDACLRPGPDSTRVNFNALTEQINATLGTDLTPKRVRTAVRHLRKARRQAAASKPRINAPCTLDASLALRDRIADARDAAHGQADDDATLTLALDILAAVRCAAGRLIDHGFGEGIPDVIDPAAIASRFDELRFDQPHTDTGRAIDRLLRTLRDCDGEPEADMRLVIDGTRVVTDLTGADSLPGVMARLNVLVAGRYLLDSATYTQRLIALADGAEALHHDAATKKLLRRARDQPEDRRIPSPLRIASYCLNNAATHLLDRLFDGRLTGGALLTTARTCIQRMQQRDSGFQLLRVTRLIEAVTLAQLNQDPAAVRSLVTGWGEATTLAVLEDLAKFDNNELIVRAAEHHATSALPALRHRLIRAA